MENCDRCDKNACAELDNVDFVSGRKTLDLPNGYIYVYCDDRNLIQFFDVRLGASPYFRCISFSNLHDIKKDMSELSLEDALYITKLFINLKEKVK